MTVILAPRAERRLRDIQAYLAAEAGVATALKVMMRIRQTVEIHADHPMIGPSWRDGPTRALTVSGLPYRVHDRIRGDDVEIITIAHTRQRPEAFA